MDPRGRQTEYHEKRLNPGKCNVFQEDYKTIGLLGQIIKGVMGHNAGEMVKENIGREVWI